MLGNEVIKFNDNDALETIKRATEILEDALDEVIKGEGMTAPVTKTPVKYHNNHAAIAETTRRNINFSDEEEEGECPTYCDEVEGVPTINPDSLKNSLSRMKKVEEIKKEKGEDEKEQFADQIKIDFISSIDYRILCRFLGVTTVNDIKNHPYQSHPLITLILMESLERYMESEGFLKVGELNFDQHGNSIPPEKNPWNVLGKETTFTTTGFLYFEKIDNNGNKNENVSFFVFADLERGGTSITAYSTDTNRSKEIINGLESYAKLHNCLRGAKLRDVNMISASFAEVEVDESYTWDNYYYDKEIKDLFDLEVFGFINNVKQYNERGIFKRGIILHGRPGSGKTTLGNIICNLAPDHTVIWITPEILSENTYRAISSIKSLYKLADFLAPCIIVLEDLDLFGQDRESGGDILSLGALMNVLDGVNSILNSVTVATTNRLKTIEAALRSRPGRFDRVIEVPYLADKLREKMFKDRLKGWKVDEKAMDFLISRTGEWTGAEVQEFINSLNLKHISSEKKTQTLSLKWAEDIIETMEKFGVGEASSSFGFGKKSENY